MFWRFWESKHQEVQSSTSMATDTVFATIFSSSSRVNDRMQSRAEEERRNLLQMLAILQFALALLMPVMLYFSGVDALWRLLLPVAFAVMFGICAWQLTQSNALYVRLMILLNTAGVPMALLVTLGWSHFSPLGVVIAFVLQMMVFLTLSLNARQFGLALWFAAFLAVITVVSLGYQSFEVFTAFLVLLIAMSVLSLIAQRIYTQQSRLGTLRQHVRKDSEKLAMRAEKMRRLALSDGLTGLANRLSLMNKLQRILAEPERARVSVLYLIDLDFFKIVNDQFGHAAGDAVLIECGKRFKSVVRRGDVVCRLGGDEFVIVVQGLLGISQAQLVAQKILQKLEEPLTYEGQVLPLGGSVGVMPWHSSVDTPEAWLSEADAAMYQAKSAGRNQFYISRSAV